MHSQNWCLIHEIAAMRLSLSGLVQHLLAGRTPTLPPLLTWHPHTVAGG